VTFSYPDWTFFAKVSKFRHFCVSKFKLGNLNLYAKCKFRNICKY
jgi:hypothetical protein